MWRMRPASIGNWPFSSGAHMNLTEELASLLVFVGNVAASLRTQSTYVRGAAPMTVVQDVMWLSDTLHGLARLGATIAKRSDLGDIASVCDELLSAYGHYRNPLPGLASDPRETFHRHAERVDLLQAESVFRRIRSKLESVPEPRALQAREAP